MTSALPIVTLCLTILAANLLWAQAQSNPAMAIDSEMLDEQQWQRMDEAVERGLQWLVTKQRDDGSFEAIELGQPAITSLCVMAFLANGESPSDGKYQPQLRKAIDFIAEQQQPNGLIARLAPSSVPISRDPQESQDSATTKSVAQPQANAIATTAVYNHAISALALCQAYGQCDPAQTKLLETAIEKAIAATLEMQNWKGKQKHDEGGWRYLALLFPQDSDLSVTGWQLMFLRSARNAGFEVPETSIAAAVKYVERCFLKDEDRRVHAYDAARRSTVTRAVAGAGILALAHAGKHNSPEAMASGEWILKHDFRDYDQEQLAYGIRWLGNRYHYGAFLCTAAMYQLGGKYWEQFFPSLVDALLENQQRDGSWLTKGQDKHYGSCYSTSLCILSLCVPNQMLPILQR